MRGAKVLRAFAALLLVVGVFPLANVLTNGRAVLWYGDVTQEWLQRGAILVTLVGVIAVFAGPRMDEFFSRTQTALLLPSTRVFALSAAVVALTASTFVSNFAFSGQPFTSDEMAQAWHARILASGHLSAIAESPREFFNTAPVLDTHGRWFSQYPIGGPAFIALGMLFNVAWLVNPALLAIATVALYRFFAAIGGELRARGATILLISSAMVLEMAGSQMSHVPALACTAVAFWALARWDASDRFGQQAAFAAVIGFALGVMATVRPFDATIVAFVVGAIQLWRIARDMPRMLGIGVQVLIGALPVAAMMWANAHTTGSATLFGYAALNGPEHGVGFHMDPTGEVHTPLRGLILMSGYLLKLNMYLFEWPLPGVLVIAAGLAALSRPTRWDGMLAGLFALVLVAYGAYWFDGFFAGPRFLFTAMPAFVYFAAALPALGENAPALVRRALLLILPICVAMAWIGPWGASSASSRIAFYREQRTKLKTPIEQQVRDAGIHNALVFVPEGWRGELLARLRVLGASQFLADRLGSTLDACVLQTALDAEARSAAPDSLKLMRVVERAQAAGVAHIVPNMPGDQAIALVPGSTPTPTCLRKFAGDSLGTMPYAMFLARQTVGRDGRVGGDIVYARDLGDRNEELRKRFGDRTWYRYRPAAPGSDARAVVFVPYR